MDYNLKRLICLMFGHRLKASFKYVEPVHGYAGLKVKHYTCVRCGKRVSVSEFKAKGWRNPGYHKVVTVDGVVHQLLDISKVSNGVQGYNSTAINIAYVGGIDSKGKPVDNRTEAQKLALRSLLKELHSQYPHATIMGHRDIWGSDSRKWKKWCPCFDAKSEYKDI